MRIDRVIAGRSAQSAFDSHHRARTHSHITSDNQSIMTSMPPIYALTLSPWEFALSILIAVLKCCVSCERAVCCFFCFFFSSLLCLLLALVCWFVCGTIQCALANIGIA